ncbi:MAG TPA: hypothetical protein VH478_14640 [Trebonia sp.]|nr:hypothetical protein [Trebonia sp.]
MPGDELKDDGGDERLGDAADPDLLPRPGRGAGGGAGHPGRAGPLPGPAAHGGHDGGLLAGGQAGDRLRQRRAVQRRQGWPRGGLAGDRDGQRQGYQASDCQQARCPAGHDPGEPGGT